MVQKKDRLVEFYTEGFISKEQFLKKMKDYDQRESFLDEKIKEVELKMNQREKTPLIIKVKFFCDLMKKGLGGPTKNKTAVFKVYCGKR